MGIDAHALNFLRYCKLKRPFGDTITLGRQEIHIGGEEEYLNEKYCEDILISQFGSTGVDSLDNSTYEGASHIADMNRDLPLELKGKYDTVFDGGVIEHVFNVSQALYNVSALCKIGAQIIHVLPANNFCGHGFWQFSPELFFSLYSEANGYEETEVFLADLSDEGHWFKVERPTQGKRVNIISDRSLYVLVRTVLSQKTFTHDEVQQSDYVYEWGQVGTNGTSGRKDRKDRRQNKMIGSLRSAFRVIRGKKSYKNKLHPLNPWLKMIKVSEVTSA